MAIVRGPEPQIAKMIEILQSDLPSKLTAVEALYASTDPIDLEAPNAKAYHYAKPRKLDLYPAYVIRSPRTGYALRLPGGTILATKDRGGGRTIFVYGIHRFQDPEILTRYMMRWQRATFEVLRQNWSLGGTVMDASVVEEITSDPLLTAPMNTFHQVFRTTVLVQLEEGI